MSRFVIVAELHQALRSLGRHRRYAATILISVVLGMALNGAVFMLLSALLWRALPYRDPDHLIALQDSRRTAERHFFTLSEYAELRQNTRAFSDVAAYRAGAARGLMHSLTSSTSDVKGVEVSGNSFALLGARTRLGRTLLPSDDYAGDTPPVVLSYGTWHREFGARRDVLGTETLIDGVPHRVVGVMDVGFWYPFEEVGFWSPLASSSSSGGAARTLSVVGRLRPGTTAEQAALETARFGAAFDVRTATVQRRAWRSVSLDEARRASDARFFFALQGLVGCVLMLACLNISSMALARTLARGRDVAVRGALGATRGQIVRALSGEIVWLAGAGALASAALAVVGVRAAARQQGAGPVQDLLGGTWIVGSVTAFAGAAGIAVIGLCGVLPALSATRRSLVLATRSGAGDTSSPRAQRLRGVLVAGQIAGCLVLLSVAGALAADVRARTRWAPSFPVTGLLTSPLRLRTGNAGRAGGTPSGLTQALRDLAAAPGVRTAGAAVRVFPRDGRVLTAAGLEVPGGCTCYRVSEGYLETLGIPLLAGRVPSPAEGRAGAAVVDEAFARQLGGPEAALGVSLRLDLDSIGAQIVSVVGVVASAAAAPPTPGQPSPPATFYLGGLDDGSSEATVLLRTAGSARATAAVRNVLGRLDRTGTARELHSVAADLERQLGPLRWYAAVVTLLAAIALVLASAGMSGLIAYLSQLRAHELAVRLAIGATPSSLGLLVARQGVVLLASGISAGGLAAACVLSAMNGQIAIIDNPGGLLAVAAVFVALVASAAIAGPAYRASRPSTAVLLRPA